MVLIVHFFGLLLRKTLGVHLGYVVIISDHVRVLEEYHCVREVTLYAV